MRQRLTTPMTKVLRKKYQIYLDIDRRKEAAVSREEWFEKYSVLNESNLIEYYKKVTPGAPMIINIWHAYYLLDKLPDICLSDPVICENWIRCMKFAVDDGNKYYVKFISKNKYNEMRTNERKDKEE